MNNLQNVRRDSNRNLPTGGQASIGLFGLLGCSRRAATAQPAAPIARRVQVPVHQAGRLASVTPHLLTIGMDRSACVHLHTGSFQAFVRLSEREQRPVEEVMAEWMADCANLIRQAEFADTYGDALPSTNAMRLAAIRADERERSAHVNDEQADAERRCAGAGYVEITLAMEGN